MPNVQLSYREEWKSDDEPCQKKLPFQLWTIMKAEGSAQSAAAQYVLENCIETADVGLIELITPEVRLIPASLYRDGDLPFRLVAVMGLVSTVESVPHAVGR